ncbi:MAG: methylated-DNA--[protein]-cysteine S-methyltransferase [Clostridiaceae bacterium]|nr:methylated-DNA--[protein]-cysteine S-methyltransferase [Clostridiaceae bacterium]
MKHVFFYDTEIGKIGIAADGNYITNVYFMNELDAVVKEADAEVKETPLIKEAGKQLKEYMEGRRTEFDLPLNPSGTEFQKNVWKALMAIPYGTTKSYRDIAREIGNEKACRAVGMANNRNPIPIFIPCHRVIGADGKLVGYGGGLDKKTYLLNLERLGA